jgi:hypothetical protein
MDDAEIIKRYHILNLLRGFHPDTIQKYNKNIAHYTGGFIDDGDINWEYCLYDCLIKELQETLDKILLGEK